MSRIWQYLLERFHPGLMGAVALVLALGCLNPFTISRWLITAAALFLYLLQLRIFDEFKDADHDKKFYPSRPVPRGLVTFGELNLLLIIVLLGQIILLASSRASWSLFVVLQAYTWLMRQEFGFKEWLRRHFTVYLVSHEIVVLPLFLYLMSITRWASVIQSIILGLSLFSLEVARKTLPGRIGANDTYVEQYGKKDAFILSLAILMSMIGLFFTTKESKLLLVPALALSFFANIYVGIRQLQSK